MTDTTRHAIAEARQALALVEDAYREHLAGHAAEPTDDDPISRAALEETIEAADAERDRLEAALDRVGAVAAELAAEADLNPVGSDEYVTLHAAAARVRGAVGSAATPNQARAT